MKNEFANRQNMHLAVLALLADPAYQPVWKDQGPVLFTARATALRPKVEAINVLNSLSERLLGRPAGGRSPWGWSGVAEISVEAFSASDGKPTRGSDEP
jgi:hypothetical protein